MINNYNFGQIIIDDIEYTTDVQVCPAGVRKWRRRQDNLLTVQGYQRY